MHTKQFIVILGLLITLWSCKELDPNKQIDEGKVENELYTSAEIGWTITIPINWDIISLEQHEEYEKKGAEAIEEIIDDQVDTGALKNLIGFQKSEFNMFQSSSEPFQEEYEGEWEINNTVVKELIFSTYQNQGINVDSTKTKVVTIDELDFLTYKFTIRHPNGEVILNQLMYSRLINGFDFSVNINYNNKVDKEEMISALFNSNFKK